MVKLENLAKLRKKKNISQAQMADFLGIPQQQYSRYETGKYDMPLTYLVKICLKYELSADEVLGLEIKESHKWNEGKKLMFEAICYKLLGMLNIFQSMSVAYDFLENTWNWTMLPSTFGAIIYAIGVALIPIALCLLVSGGIGKFLYNLFH